MLAQAAHWTHLKTFYLNGPDTRTGDTMLSGFAATPTFEIGGHQHFPNTPLTLQIHEWATGDTQLYYDLNSYTQHVPLVTINAGTSGGDLVEIRGDATAVLTANGGGGYGSLMNGGQILLSGGTFDAVNSIIALRANAELTVTGSTVHTESYILMNHGPANSTLNVGENGIVDAKLLRLADMSDPANLHGVVNLNTGGVIKTSLIWVDGTNASDAVFRFNGGTLENHADATYDPYWIWDDHSNVVAGGANIKVDRDITIPTPLFHDPNGAAIDGGLTKLGPSNLTLGAVCTYTGPTVVSVGTLVVQNDISSSSSVTVNPGAAIKLEAEAAVGDVNLTAGSSFNPGSSFGTNVANAIVMETGSSYEWEVGGGGNDLVIADSLDVSGATIDINVTLLGNIAASDTNMLFKLNNVVVADGGTVVNINGTGTDAAELVYVGTDILITGVVPEPAILGLLAILGLAFFRRK